MRVDEGFRVTVRVYGLEVPKDTLSVIRIFDMNTNDLLYEEIYGFQSFPNAPDIAMECDITTGRTRASTRSCRPRTNATQRFTVITPK